MAGENCEKEEGAAAKTFFNWEGQRNLGGKTIGASLDHC